MQRDPRVCVDDAISACRLIISFTEEMNVETYVSDQKTKAAVERQFEILGEALNRLKKIDESLLSTIDNSHAIIGFRNVIAHGYDMVEDEIVWDAVQRNIPVLVEQLERLLRSL